MNQIIITNDKPPKVLGYQNGNHHSPLQRVQRRKEIMMGKRYSVGDKIILEIESFNDDKRYPYRLKTFGDVPEEFIDRYEVMRDWSQIDIDTAVMIRQIDMDAFDTFWVPAYFAGYEFGKVRTWCDGVTSFTSKDGGVVEWDAADVMLYEDWKKKYEEEE